MKECDFLDSLTIAEKACADVFCEIFRTRTFICANRGCPDCNVFDIGFVQSGDQMAYDSDAYHFRAKLDMYRRDRSELQRDIMKLLAELPIGQDSRVESTLRENSNVVCFRIATETRAISEISTASVAPENDASPIPCYLATVQFDVVFAVVR